MEQQDKRYQDLDVSLHEFRVWVPSSKSFSFSDVFKVDRLSDKIVWTSSAYIHAGLCSFLMRRVGTDKDGKAIFQGDIYKAEDGLIAMVPICKEILHTPPYYKYEVEVIGNLFESIKL